MKEIKDRIDVEDEMPRVISKLFFLSMAVEQYGIAGTSPTQDECLGLALLMEGVKDEFEEMRLVLEKERKGAAGPQRLQAAQGRK